MIVKAYNPQLLPYQGQTSLQEADYVTPNCKPGVLRWNANYAFYPFPFILMFVPQYRVARERRETFPEGAEPLDYHHVSELLHHKQSMWRGQKR